METATWIKPQARAEARPILSRLAICEAPRPSAGSVKFFSERFRRLHCCNCNISTLSREQLAIFPQIAWLLFDTHFAQFANDELVALFHPETPANVAFWREAQAAMPEVGINVMAAGVHDASEVERAITAVAAQPNGGLIVYPHTVTEVHLRLIIELAGKYRLPAVYPFRYHAEAGGLLSYGVDSLDLVPRAADYVDRIMRGANPGELPVQAPTKFELVINLKTAKALGLEIPQSLLARADEVIE